jgi:hypothetical protein
LERYVEIAVRGSRVEADSLKPLLEVDDIRPPAADRERVRRDRWARLGRAAGGRRLGPVLL